MLTFACYVLINGSNTLTPGKVFVSIALFDIMRVPLGLLPLIIVFTAQVRPQKFLHQLATVPFGSIIHLCFLTSLHEGNPYKLLVISPARWWICT